MSTTQPLYFSLFRLLQNLSKKTKKLCLALLGIKIKPFWIGYKQMRVYLFHGLIWTLSEFLTQ